MHGCVSVVAVLWNLSGMIGSKYPISLAQASDLAASIAAAASCSICFWAAAATSFASHGSLFNRLLATDYAP